MDNTATERTPKRPTAFAIGDHVHIYGRTLVVVMVNTHDWNQVQAEDRTVMDVEARDDQRIYRRMVYFVAHKNLWRSRWMRS